METRDSFIFYRSFAEAIAELPDEYRLQCYDAICSFALDLEEPQLDGVPKAIFTLVKPQLEANYKKYLNGKAKRKQDGSKAEAKRKQDGSKAGTNVNVNVNDNVNVNENVNVNHHVNVECGTIQSRLTEEEMDKLFDIYDSVELVKLFDTVNENLHGDASDIDRPYSYIIACAEREGTAKNG